jgi:hypothetical protein
MEKVESRLERGMTAEEEVAEEVFKRSFIPRTLEDVPPPAPIDQYRQDT